MDINKPKPKINKLLQLNEYELEQNAKKECVRKHRFHKKHHDLTPEQLQTGFGLHTLSSLEIALKKSRTPTHICLCKPCDDGEEAFGQEGDLDGIEREPAFMAAMAQERLKYLMGLPSGAEEDVRRDEEPEEEYVHDDEEDLINGGSEAMRRAQRYLRQHKIFEFFQFLIAHLLSEIPFDPINFLINLLDKCLIYRSGICDPPLLYDKKHIACLFNLMDRMRTGFIEFDQYKTGMMTLGIKSFNTHPPMTADGSVTKLYFVEEGYNCLTDLLNDMIRKRTHEVKKSKKVPKAPPPSQVRSVCPSISDADIFV